jgi:hypothetical protein
MAAIVITSIAFASFIFFYLLVMPQIEEYYLNKGSSKPGCTLITIRR